MEQSSYWTWAKRSKPDSNPSPTAAMNSYGDSWEEQAFAEDAAGTLGGCVWPPRSYSCSFCGREFRSAQALGGHMNVHRRDRARLKQSPIDPPTEVVPPCTTFDASPYSSQICTFLYNNPNPEFVSPVSHVIRVSSPPAMKKVNGHEQNTSTLCFASQNNEVVSSHPPSWSSFIAEKSDTVLDSIKNEEKKSAAIEPDLIKVDRKEDRVTDDTSMSLNLLVCRTRTEDEEIQIASCKRRRIETKPSNFFSKLSAADICTLPQSEVLIKLCSGSAEELDLELRLGNAPKVK